VKDIKRILAVMKESHIRTSDRWLQEGQLEFSIIDTDIDINYLRNISGKRFKITIEEVEE